MCMCVSWYVWERNYDNSYVYYLKLTEFCEVVMEPAYCYFIFWRCVCVCVPVWAVADRAGELRLIKLQEGCAGITFTSSRKTTIKKRIEQAGQSWKQGCPVMSDMWYYLRRNPPGLGTILLVGYCALQWWLWWGVGSELRCTLVGERSGPPLPPREGCLRSRHRGKSLILGQERRTQRESLKEGISCRQRWVTLSVRVIHAGSKAVMNILWC